MLKKIYNASLDYNDISNNERDILYQRHINNKFYNKLIIEEYI